MSGRNNEFSDGLARALKAFFCMDCRIQRPLNQRVMYRKRYMCDKCRARRKALDKASRQREYLRS